MIISSEPAAQSADPSLPIHLRIRLELEHAILTGSLKPGDRLPSEAELCETYHASKTPVRHALQLLEAAGLIYRAQGRGAFVRERKIGGGLRNFAGLNEELRQNGHTVEPHTLSVEMVPCDADTARALNLSLSSRVIAIHRLYIVDGEPLVLFEHRLSPLVPLEPILAAGDFPSLYELLRSEGFDLREGEEVISATLLSRTQADLLHVKRPVAALLMRRTSRTPAGIPIEFTSYVMRADRYEHRVSLRRTI
jgi:GntR family transcriptional regulator